MVKFVASDLDGTLLDGKGNLPAALFPLIEALSEKGFPFVPENGYPPLKERFGGRVPSNAEGGVLIKLREILEAS